MSQVLEYQGLPENLWDMGRLIAGAAGLTGSGVAGASLSPTVANPACWALYSPSYWQALFSIWFGTDTAMVITLYSYGADPGYAHITPHQLGKATGTSATFEAAVAALPGALVTLWPVQLPAGFAGEILVPAWLWTNPTVILATPAIAANCTCSMKWIEFGRYPD